MNYLQRTLAAAALSLAAGCTSTRQDQHRHDDRVRTPYTSPAPHLPPHTPHPLPDHIRIPQLPTPPINPPLPDDALQHYERILPTTPIPNADPLERRIEDTIYEQHNVHIQGDVTIPMLTETKHVLDDMPELHPCTIYFVPDTLQARRQIAGWYTASQPFDFAHIVLLKPPGAELPAHHLRRTLIHEQSHRHAHKLGEPFLYAWLSTNTHSYQTDLIDDNGYRWMSHPHTGARYGFVEPYAAKNIHEDIASLTEAVRMNDSITVHDEGTATVLARKRKLLLEYHFIHPHEELTMTGNTTQTLALSQVYKNTLLLGIGLGVLTSGLIIGRLRKKQ